MDAFPTFNERTVFVTRSVDRQEFRLRPDTKVNEAIKYLLMVISKRYKLSPHCICALSNHLHSILTDPEAKFPAFLSDFHSLITKCVNHIYGDTGSLWDKKQTNRLYLDDVETIKKQVGYTMANPVAAGLVEEGTLWPGVRACWPAEKEVIRRPDFFRRLGSRVKQPKGSLNRRPHVAEVDAMNSKWEAEGVEFPPYVVFRLERPPGFDDMDNVALADELRAQIADADQDARDKRKSAGKRSYLGAEKVLELPRWSRSRKLHERFAFVPKVITRNRDARLEAWRRHKWWREAHADSFAAWQSDPNVEFPIGTYQHRVFHGAKVSATAPPGF